MKFKKGDRVIWKPKPGSDWEYPSNRFAGVPPTGTLGTVYSRTLMCKGEWICVDWDGNDPGRSFGFPIKYIEPYVEAPQAGVPWIYPEEGHEWKEGDEIIAEYTIPVTRTGSTARMRYQKLRACGHSYYAWGFHNGNSLQASNVRIIAYIPYTKPNPPEKPQDCPFCGSKTWTYHNWYGDWISVCENEDCSFRIPPRKTKEEAIKALNSVKVVKE